MAMVKINNSSFVRDTNSMAIINTDSHAKNEYLSKVNMINRQKNEINKVNDEVNYLKTELSEIKELLNKLLEK
jgi:hypothetical protein